MPEKPERGIDDDDGLQVGRMAALNAVRAHDPGRGALDHLAWMWISSKLDRETLRRRRHLASSCAPSIPAADPVISEETIAVRIAVDGLPDRLRKIVHARMAGFTFNEIGVEMGVTRERDHHNARTRRHHDH